jgi:carbon storage regulator CsrA
MLCLIRRSHERILIDCHGVEIVIEVIEIRAGRVKLGIAAPVDVAVDRPEVRARKEWERRTWPQGEPRGPQASPSEPREGEGGPAR